jgi:hypothetical protein
VLTAEEAIQVFEEERVELLRGIARRYPGLFRGARIDLSASVDCHGWIVVRLERDYTWTHDNVTHYWFDSRERLVPRLRTAALACARIFGTKAEFWKPAAWKLRRSARALS